MDRFVSTQDSDSPNGGSHERSKTDRIACEGGTSRPTRRGHTRKAIDQTSAIEHAPHRIREGEKPQGRRPSADVRGRAGRTTVSKRRSGMIFGLAA